MTANKEDTIAQLKSIFPQRSLLIINNAYDEAEREYGPNSQPFILTSCIEKLLEVPDPQPVVAPQLNVIPPVVAPNVAPEYRGSLLETSVSDIDSDSDHSGYLLRNRSLNDSDNPFGYRDSDDNPNEEDDNNSDNNSDNNDDDDSSDDELYNPNTNGLYRNKNSFISYRANTDSEDSNISVNLLANLADDDDKFLKEVQVIEERSTRPDQMRHSVYDKDDILLIGNNSKDQSGLASIVNEINEEKENIQQTLFNNMIDAIPKDILIDSKIPSNRRPRSVFEPSSTITPRTMSTCTASGGESSSSSSKSTPKVVVSDINRKRKHLAGHTPVPVPPTHTPLPSRPAHTPVPVRPAHTPVPVRPAETPVTPAEPVPLEEKFPVHLLQYGMDGFLENAVSQICAVICDVEPVWLRNEITKVAGINNLAQVVNNMVGSLLDNKNFPKKKTPSRPSLVPETIVVASTDYFNIGNEYMNNFNQYTQEALTLLQNEFTKIPTKAVRKALGRHYQRYAASWKDLHTAMEEIGNGKKGVEQTIICSFLKSNRPKIHKNPPAHPTLLNEIEYVEKYKKEIVEEKDRNVAENLNNLQYEEEGQAIECGCCFGESVFEDMVQCLEGHLFCGECLVRYSKEAVFGEGKAQLFCMTADCDSSFPHSQLKKALPPEVMEKYYERVQDEDIKLANMEDLIRCPFCDFAAVLPEEENVFSCLNASCRKQSCRHCQENWDDHFGLKCNEVEKKSQTNMRITYEEKMTKAKCRTCWQCKTSFLKETGCNKMTCRCGAKMCYICRQAKIDYNHFCQHVREPGHGCDKCTKCSLWTDPTEDDERAVREIQKEAETERKRLLEAEGLGTDVCNMVGPPPEMSGPKHKKQRLTR